MKNRKLWAFIGVLAVLTLGLASCGGGGKGKLTITGIGNQYKGYYIVGYEDSGDYIFAASATSLDDAKGAVVKKSTVTLNVYEITDDGETYAPFLGEISMLRGNVIICLLKSDDFAEIIDSEYAFINNTVISFENGAAKVDFATHFEKD